MDLSFAGVSSLPSIFLYHAWKIAGAENAGGTPSFDWVRENFICDRQMYCNSTVVGSTTVVRRIQLKTQNGSCVLYRAKTWIDSVL